MPWIHLHPHSDRFATSHKSCDEAIASLSLQLTCSVTGYPPPLPLTHLSPSLTPSVVECQWSEFEDPHSGITEFALSVSQAEQLLFNTTLDGEPRWTHSFVLTNPISLSLQARSLVSQLIHYISTSAPHIKPHSKPPMALV